MPLTFHGTVAGIESNAACCAAVGSIEDKRRAGYDGPSPWKVRYRVGSSSRSKAFKTRREAARWLADLDTRRARGDRVDPTAGREPFDRLVERWFATQVHIRDSTRRVDTTVINRHLIAWFGDTPVRDIQRADIRDFIADQTTRAAPGTVAYRTRILGRILRWAVDEHIITVNPVDRVRLPVDDRRPIHPLTLEQLARLADHATPAWFRPMILCAGLVGLRLSELRGVCTQHVDPRRNTIRVEWQLHNPPWDTTVEPRRPRFTPPKSKSSKRTVSVPRMLMVELVQRLEEPAVHRYGLVFPNPNGTPIWDTQFRRMWDDTRQAAALGGPHDTMRFHDLRHTAAALAIEQGAHPTAIKERLGHSSIKTTLDTYGFMFPRVDEAISERLDDAWDALHDHP